MKKTIAVDIDDVLSTSAEDIVAYSNKSWGMHLTVSDYKDNWMQMWQVDAEESNKRANEFHASGVMCSYGYKKEALGVLERLKERFKLVVVTSRNRDVEQETVAWISKHFNGLFSGVHFAGIWDGVHNESSGKLTKASLCKELGVDYLIDDQPKHCNATASAGIPAILFGDYPWSESEKLGELVSRARTWHEVEVYFNEQ